MSPTTPWIGGTRTTACCSSIVDWTSAATVASILPFGPNKPFLGNSSGWVARLVEDWQVSAIYNLTSGIPMTVVGRSGLYESRSSSNFAAFTPETTVAPVDLTPAGFQKFGNFTGIGEVEWKDGAVSGTYFPGITFVRVPDPQCAECGHCKCCRPTAPGPLQQRAQCAGRR